MAHATPHRPDTAPKEPADSPETQPPLDTAVVPSQGFRQTYLSPGVRFMLWAVLLFALMNVGVKWLVGIPSAQIVWVRSVVTLVMCWWSLRRLGLPMTGSRPRLLIYRGLAGSVALLCFFYTLQHMPLASAATMHFLAPVITTLLATYWLHEPIRRIQWLFILMAFGGVAMVKGFDVRIAPLDFGIAVVGAVASGIAYNLVRRLKGTAHPLVVVLYFPLVTLPLITVPIFWNWVWPSPLEWALMLGVGVITQVAQLNLTKSYQAEPVQRVAPIIYTGIFYALGFGYFIFGETYEWPVLLGMGLVILGLLLNLRFGVR